MARVGGPCVPSCPGEFATRRQGPSWPLSPLPRIYRPFLPLPWISREGKEGKDRSKGRATGPCLAHKDTHTQSETGRWCRCSNKSESRPRLAAEASRPQAPSLRHRHPASDQAGMCSCGRGLPGSCCRCRPADCRPCRGARERCSKPEHPRLRQGLPRRPRFDLIRPELEAGPLLARPQLACQPPHRLPANLVEAQIQVYQ